MCIRDRVLINLLENAVLHAAGATQIWLNVTDEGQNVCFEVADDGCGIEESRLSGLFDGAVSSSQGNSDGRRNMGIGLSVCRTIIRAHGGEITVFNRKQGGADFRFTLPKEDKAL